MEKRQVTAQASGAPGEGITNTPDSNSHDGETKAEDRVVIKGNHSQDGPRETQSLVSRLRESPAWEALALLISAGALAAMALVVNRYDGKPIPTWYHSGVELSLNSVISGIAQLKWAWLALKPRRVADMSAFSDGSGDLRGAAGLIYLLRAKHVAVLGALAVILTIAFDPFTQNLIEYYDDNVPDASQIDQLGRNSNWTAVGPKITYSPPLNLKGNAYKALLSSGRDEDVNPQVVCPTSNCTWSPMETIAFQTHCTNISSLVRNSCSNSNSTGSKSCQITIQGSPLNLTWYWHGSSPGVLFKSRSFAPKDSISHQDGNITNRSFLTNVFQGRWPHVNRTRLEAGGSIASQNTTFSATECVLLPAVHRIRASVDHGVYQEEILNTWTEVKSSEQKRLDDGLKDFILTPPWANGRTFNIRYETLSGLWAADYFTSTPYLEDIQAGNATTADGNSAMLFNNEYAQSIVYSNFSRTCDTPDDMYGCSVKTVANALTTSIRDAPLLASRPEPAELAAGTVFVTTTFIRVHWAYLSLHLMVWAFSATTWLVAVWLTLRRNIPFWRDSPLPLLFSFQNGQATGNAPGASNSELEERAGHTRIRLNIEGGRHGAFLESH
ncbi:hypothetical protein BJ875DRAFT_487181 [Amylocarpus encephaloides]|uniref:Uncharacterized protein n=1 Tax=Amylocarpus encephaloides TaxID=45428 RepID=A0A9P7YC97_9HELO|nr:hypothetical protein BJ875DRAFT_487181 [Amylocarpus encephaloides]